MKPEASLTLYVSDVELLHARILRLLLPKLLHLDCHRYRFRSTQAQ